MKRTALSLLLLLSSCDLGTGLPVGAIALLTGCATHPPQVVTKEVDIPVPVHCAPKLGTEPDYLDSDAKLKAAPNIVAWAKALAEGRLQRIQRDVEKTAALTACE